MTQVTAADFEKLGVFYLGRPFDLATGTTRPGLVLYDSRDLVTHAVCIGMTGSGKTGLCLALLEEAALDGVPAIAIDPKGDLPNLLLTFPGLSAGEFLPWVNADDARRKALTVEAFAAQQAELWRTGLGEWGQDADRIRRLRAAADFAVYTPGSHAGLPVSILRSFAAPPLPVRTDPDLFRERVQTAATGLLALLGVAGDPLRSRDHILLANLLEAAWREGRDLDLPGLIQAIQTPPLARIGALELETFYPAQERFALAALLNNLLAAPGFDAWLDGAPLDVGALLHTPTGAPRVSIFSIAHLGDAERMFFVSLLLNEILGWMRTQSGTTTLRAIVYMDEIFGYLPPVANPPSKAPLLTLLKQARAFGVGVVLATQNPVDLDYKGLANTGTWFIGRLQTERDKMRVLEGLEGVAAGAGGGFDRQAMDALLASLGTRVFLLHNVHEAAPAVFQTRWAMSYLRGPLTREQIKTLMGPRKTELPAATAPSGPAVPAAASRAAPAAAALASPTRPAAGGPRPVLPPGVPQHFLPVGAASPPAGSTLVYRPMVLGAATVRFVDAKTGVDVSEEQAWLAPFGEGAIPVSWDDARAADVDLSTLAPAPREPAEFAPLPPAATTAKSYDGWGRAFTAWLAATRELTLWRSPDAKLVSRPGASERDFRIRLAEAQREERDRLKARLEKTYAPKVAAVEERLRRAQQALEREKTQVTQAGLQAAISVGATLLGALLGRKTVSVGSIGRATTAARGAGRVLKERQDIGRAEETVQAVQRELEALDAEFKAELARLEPATDPLADRLETVVVRPKKTHIRQRLCALAWAPEWRDARGATIPAWD